MRIELLQPYWALVIGALIGTFVLVFVLIRLYADSRRGRLRLRVRELQKGYKEVARLGRAVQRAERTLNRLLAKADRIRPRRLQSAKNALKDAEALQKIAQDQVLVAENHVRNLILDEFPPRRHDALRDRYLARPEPDGKPFTF